MDKPSRDIRVMLIEDNPGDAYLIEHYLSDVEYNQFSLCHVTDLGKAKIRMRDQDFDIILADLGLPDSQGLDTIRSIKRDFPDLPLVVLTGNSDTETGLNALKIGAQDYLVKESVNSDVVNRVLRYALERHAIEQRLRISETKYRSMVENISLGVYLIDSEFHIIELNQKMKSWFPNISDTGSMKCFSLFGNENARQPCTDCPAIKSIKESTITEKICQVERNGEQRFYRVLSSAIQLKNSNEPGVINIVDDITERKQLEMQLHQSQKLEAVGQLAGGIAHDFNNVLQAISGFAELAIESVYSNPDSCTKALSDVLSSTRQAAELTQQLLAYGRRQVLQLKRTDLNTMIEPVVRMLRRVLGEQISIELSLNPSPLIVDIDTSQIGQIFMNLCINARDAMPHGGHLRISTKKAQISSEHLKKHPDMPSGDYAVFTVSDTGCGIEESKLPHIFEPFYTSKKPGEGTGLGLATVYGVIQQHNGLIHVESDVGKGTCFIGYIPLSEDTVDLHTLRQRDTQVSILLIDENADVRRMTTRMLKRNGYDVDAIDYSVESVAQYLESNSPPNVWMISPAICGKPLEATLQYIHQNVTDCRIIIVTDCHKNLGRLKMVTGISYIVLEKPFTSKGLSESINTIMRR